MICIVHIQPMEHVPDRADDATPSRQQELDRSQIRNISALMDLDLQVRIDDLSMICPRGVVRMLLVN